MDQGEIPLKGGHINTVVRVGDTVRRSPRANSALRRDFIAHLVAAGFSNVPRFLGHDEAGREILTFLPGHVPHDEGQFSDSQLVSAARLLRQYHDASANFPAVRIAGAEVMCHNDWSPANTVFADDLPYAMIDFDTTAPGTRLWDLSYSVWTWLDLGDPDWDPGEQRRRLALFVEAYDHPSCTPGLVAACLPARQAGRAQWGDENGFPAGADWARTCLDWTLTHITHVMHPVGLEALVVKPEKSAR